MKPEAADPRSLASWIIDKALTTRSSTDRIFAQVDEPFDERDRRLWRELSLGTLRWLRRLDDVIESASSRRIESVDARLRTPLRVAAYQILYLDRIPAHAAVNCAVEEARRRTHRGGAGFTNAVLRRIASSPDLGAWPVQQALPSRTLAIETSHSDFLVERWLRNFGEARTRDLLDANNRRKPAQLLALAGAGGRDAVARRLADEGVTAEPSQLSPVGLVVVEGDARQTECWRRGEIYLQDGASQAAALIPPPRHGETILDLAAAPGGKTFALLAAEPEVTAIGCDRDFERLLTMRDNASRLQLSCRLALADGVAPPWTSEFDRVVLDLPCTGTGTLRKHPELKWRIDDREIDRLSRQGLGMVEAAARLVRVGGLLTVVTCSLEPEENSQLVARFLAERGDFTRCDLRGRLSPTLSGGLIGVGEWQVLPADVHDGFTVNVLQRRS